MYKLTKTQKQVEGIQKDVYGIRYGDEVSVPDVSTDRAMVEELVKRVNEGELAPCQLKDVVEDYLN